MEKLSPVETGRKLTELADKKRERDLARRYGMTIEDYCTLLLKQGGACGCCGQTEKRLVVDHDHHTNQVRGLLCDHCNRSIGALGDDIPGVESALDYLKDAYADHLD